MLRYSMLIQAMVGLVIGTNKCQAQTVLFKPGQTKFICRVKTHTTTGGDMGGMIVTARFPRTNDTVKWQRLDSESGAATGNFLNWTLHQSNTTGAVIWTLTNNSSFQMTSLRLVTLIRPNDTVFDVAFSPSTPSSRRGLTFDLPGEGTGQRIVATYSNRVAIVNAKPFGDLFSQLDIEFLDGLPSGAVLKFWADTDTVLTLDDCQRYIGGSAQSYCRSQFRFPMRRRHLLRVCY